MALSPSRCVASVVRMLAIKWSKYWSPKVLAIRSRRKLSETLWIPFRRGLTVSLISLNQSVGPELLDYKFEIFIVNRIVIGLDYLLYSFGKTPEDVHEL